MKRLFFAVAASLMLPLTGCGDDASGGAVEPKMSSIQTEILNKSCAVSSACHIGSNPGGDLNLEAANAYSQLVDVDSVQADAATAGLKRVKAGSSAESLLYLKLIGDDYGDQMPQRAAQLSLEKIKAVQEWIDAGAAND